MAGKRSPRYPRMDLFKTLEIADRLYKGAHQSKIDADTAAKVMGYTNSASGAAAVALGALRQYGLVNGLRGDVQISDLALSILQPMDDNERLVALHTAANNPEIFAQILDQFGGELPRSDEPVKAFLVRHQGFSQGGAAEVLSVLRETISRLPSENKSDRNETPASSPPSTNASSSADDSIEKAIPSLAGELIILPLGSGCKVELHFTGKMTPITYDRLIKHLHLLRETLGDE